jgi:hypothetical protein
LYAVVAATASLERGIDIGNVGLVRHIGAPRNLAVLLQRAGRSGHWLGAIPKGIFYPLTRDHLMQSIAAIRASGDSRLRTSGLLVRPHPQNWKQWEHVDLAAEFDNVAFWPKTGVNPIGGAARSDYFDSIYHSEAVVGVNTSAMIESGIIGRPVYTVQAEEFAATQEGTLHFQHL